MHKSPPYSGINAAYWVIFIPPLKSRRCPSRRISSAFTYVFQITQTVTLKYPSLSRKMRKNQVVN